MENLTAKDNVFADLKEFAVAKIGALAGKLEASQSRLAFAGAFNA